MNRLLLSATRHGARALAACSLLLATAMTSAQDVPLTWLGDQVPRVGASGISWGVPFSKGQVSAEQKFALKKADGTALPVQQWPLAYWPDGSMKWIGFATVAGTDVNGLSLSPVAAAQVAAPQNAVTVNDTAQNVTISNGLYQVVINKSGPNFIESITMGERVTSQNGRLELVTQSAPPADVFESAAVTHYRSNVKQVMIEQAGPVRATVRVQGMHKQVDGDREWLPFDIRLYFYADAQPIRMVHNFIWDGDQYKDFVRGMGITFDVPMKEEIQNRHVRFGGENDGLWAEPIQPLIAWRGGVTGPNGNVYPDQVAGRRVPNRADVNNASRALIENLAIWSDYRLMQPNADGFQIEKRTGSHSAWVESIGGKRASGTVFVGDVSGGFSASLKDFWQSYPKSLEVRNAKEDTAQLRVWLWSPDAPVMDVRHYADHAHGLDYNYEDVEMELATAEGIGRTHELTLFPSGDVPTHQTLANLEQDGASPPLIVATPKWLHDQRAFGMWALYDDSTPFKAAVEANLNNGITYYQTMIEDHDWYGFWDYGDVMHGYDPTRHMWRYDVGGFAWDNSEQGTDMWLWYMFLHTGRKDIFRMAEAMTRHTSEVDFHHTGKIAGLGSRHNVRHWGDGAKEARISMAHYRRFYYYLTTDERTGDVMRDALKADQAIKLIDPMRKADPPVPGDEKYKARIRGGPDWFAIAGNWMTEWERTQNTEYRDKILKGVESIYAFPFKFSTGQNLLWGFDPDTGEIFARSDRRGGYNLVTNMGGPEIMQEMIEHVDDPRLTEIWLDYCRNAGGKTGAWVYFKTKDEAAGRRAIGALNNTRYFSNIRSLSGPDVPFPISEGPTGLVTNDNNNWVLHAVQILDMCADLLPTEAPVQAERGGRRGGGGPGAPGGRGRGQRGGRGGPRGGAPNAEEAPAAQPPAGQQ